MPIIPGLKVLKSVAQLKSLPSTFHVDLPSELVNEILQKPDHCAEIGMQWAKRQCEDLLAKGHLNLHFYVMNDASYVRKVIQSMGYL